MNSKVIFLVASGVLGFSGSTLAASDNTINFQGEVTAQTCDLNVNGGQSTPVVLLPTVTDGAFSQGGTVTVGNTAGGTSFDISISNCTVEENTSISTIFVANSVESTAGTLNNTGTATGVNIQLVDTADVPINLNTEFNGNGDLSLTGGETEKTASYTARYYATDTAITAGTVLASVQYAISYN